MFLTKNTRNANKNSVPYRLSRDVLMALRKRRDLTFNTPNRLTDFVLIKSYLDKEELEDLTSSRLAINRLIDDGLARLEKGQQELANILQKRFIDGQSQREITNPSLGISRDKIKHLQEKGVEHLTDIIWKLELEARKEQREKMMSALSLTKHESMFGVQQQVKQVADFLMSPTQTVTVAISGIGGIGKTALAQMVVSHIIDQFHFDQLLWIHIDNEQIHGDFLTLPLLVSEITQQLQSETRASFSAERQQQQIRHTLKSAAYLIIIDNLKKEITPEVFLQLQEWSERSRFLLTCRLDLPPGVGVTTIHLDELPLVTTTELIRDQARKYGPEELAYFSPPEIEPIYNVVGGNPLAIKLVISLARTRPLPQILADLQQADTKEVEELYHYIYRQAWDTLSSNSRLLLQAMYTAPEIGFEAKDMQALSKLDDASFWTTVDELAKHSLLKVRGSIYERRYGIHRLSASFLQTGIIHLPDNKDENKSWE